MKKSKTTMKQLLADAPEVKRIDLIEPISYSSLDEKTLRKYSLEGKIIAQYYLFVKYEDGFYFSICDTQIVRKGARVFPKSLKQTIVSTYRTKYRLKFTCTRDVETLLDVFGVRGWWKENECIDYGFFNKSTILRAVLTGKVYSQETLMKEWAKVSFGLDKVDWKAFRKFIYCSDYYKPSIFDLRDFTTDINKSMKIYVESKEKLMLADLVKDAVLLNKKVNFGWSEKRMLAEHLNNSRLLMKDEIENKDQTQLYERTVGDEDITMLNSESEVFSEGFRMSHCIYTHYYDKIRSHDYLGFHMFSPEDCTFGVAKHTHIDGETKVVLDQIYRSHDRSVKDETRKKAQRFIENNLEALKGLLDGKPIVPAEPAMDDLPF